MRLATVRHEGFAPAVAGVVDGGGRFVLLQEAHRRCVGGNHPALVDMLSLIDAGPEVWGLARSLIDSVPEPAMVRAADVALLAPLPEPRQIRDFLCFEEHLANCYRTLESWGQPQQQIPPVWYQQPIYYKANRLSVVGHEADVQWPSYSAAMDYELELAVVLGRRGVDIARENALDHVFGITIFNDVTARDAQGAEMPGTLGPAKGKDFDTGNVFGPWIVTLDEIPDLHDLTMVARVNGKEWSRGSTSSMHHRFDDVIAFVSRSETLHPGEILGSGTVGTGCGLELGRFLQPGDIVELEVQDIGVLRNRIGVPADG